MQARTNELYSHLVNKSIIMYKLSGHEQAMHMMVKAGLPRNVINRVLDKSAKVRTSDWK
ncbi:MAG: phage tail protein [Pseudomonadota bacterium]